MAHRVVDEPFNPLSSSPQTLANIIDSMSDLKKTPTTVAADLGGDGNVKSTASSTGSDISPDPTQKARWWQFKKYTEEQKLVLKLDLFIL